MGYLSSPKTRHRRAWKSQAGFQTILFDPVGCQSVTKSTGKIGRLTLAHIRGLQLGVSTKLAADMSRLDSCTRGLTLEYDGFTRCHCGASLVATGMPELIFIYMRIHVPNILITSRTFGAWRPACLSAPSG